jgi:hypothetical protein
LGGGRDTFRGGARLRGARRLLSGQSPTLIRHGYVHANRKRRKVVLSATNLATFWAWQMSLWYQEVALLYLLDHRGQYRNRMTAEWLGQVETVPWA